MKITMKRPGGELVIFMLVPAEEVIVLEISTK